MVFDKRSASVMKDASNYPTFASYFLKRIKPALKNYVHHATQLRDVEPNWTNNNCESLNHIMKLDAKWKAGTTPDMISMLREIVSLHFGDMRRALYGSGNYRLVSSQRKRFGISHDIWGKMDEKSRCAKFEAFLKNRYNRKNNIVKSTNTNFVVMKPSTARKPGQKKRIRVGKSGKKFN